MTTERIRIPTFQLLQWKAAIKLEAKGMRHSSGRSVLRFAKQALGLSPMMKAEGVVQAITTILEERLALGDTL